MRKERFLELLCPYVLVVTISAPLMAIITLILFQKCNIKTLILGLMYGLAMPGLLLFNFFNQFLLFVEILSLEFIIIISLIPWVILGVLLFTNKKKWTFFVGLFILLYTLYGALMFVLMMMR